VLSIGNLSACQMTVLTQVANYVEGAGISEIRKISIALHGVALQKTLLFLVTTLRISDSSYSCCNLCPYFIPYVTFFTVDFYFIYFRKQAGWDWVYQFCTDQNSESTSLHLSRYQILQCRKVPKYWWLYPQMLQKESPNFSKENCI